MKAKWLCIMVLGAQAWCATAHAAGTSTASATMEVSFRVLESCAIRAARDTAATQVACAYSTPYRIERQPASAAGNDGPSTSEQAPGIVVVSF